MRLPVVPKEIQATYCALFDEERVHDECSGGVYWSPLVKSENDTEIGTRRLLKKITI